MSRGLGNRRERGGANSFMNRNGTDVGGGLSGSGVDKIFEKMIRLRLEQFKDGSEMELKLEPMNREQRKLTHSLAGRFDLKSHSTGSDGSRRITISRRTFKGNLVSCLGAIETKPLKLNKEQIKSLSQLISKYPIDEVHIENHLRPGYTARRNHVSRNTSGLRMIEQMLVPPATNENSEMRRFRETLPTYKYRGEILKAIRNHKVTLITGGTGCGKTTQVPQFILEEATAEGRALRIVCTQPRRLPAIAVADRVAKERNERLGTTVGYHIRLEQKTSNQTVLTYCTSGVLLRMLTIEEIAHSISHILLDEIHEREQNTDYLLIALKQALKSRGDLKVILMSATMEGNLDTFMRYFGDIDVAHIDIPSRLYPVEKFFLSEVLALTGYKPPRSLFGGTFSSTGLGQSHGQSTRNFDRFPQVDEFRCDALVNEKSSSSSEHRRRNGATTSSELISVRTAPNLGTLISAAAAASSSSQQSNGVGSCAPPNQTIESSSFGPQNTNPYERCFIPASSSSSGPAGCTSSGMPGMIENGANASTTATLITSASTSALHSHHNIVNLQQPSDDEFEKLARTLADTNWNEIKCAEMSTQNQHHQPPTTAQSQHVFSISSSDGIFNVSGNVANITGQSGAGTDSTEDGPDIVELPDSDEEYIRIQTHTNPNNSNIAVSQQHMYAAMQPMEQIGITQQSSNFLTHPPPDWNIHQTQQQQAPNPYTAPPFCAAQFSYQQTYQFVQPPQHVTLNFSPPMNHQAAATNAHYGLAMTHPPPLPSAAQHHQQPSSTTPLIYSAQYPSTSTHHPFPQNTNTAISTIFAAAPAQNQATPRFYVAQDGAAFDNCFISAARQQQQNCSQQQQHVINQEYSYAPIHQNGFIYTQHQPQQQQTDHCVAPMCTLPNRPSSFDPICVDVLRRVQLNNISLIEDYLSCGGQQWTDGVDPDLTVAVIKYCMDSPVDGSILVFLPGYEDILTIRESVINELEHCQKRPVIFTLHSQMNSQDQQKVFDAVPVGCRKVILSTNIAEASLTIDDVVFVVDCGKVKEKTYDHSTRINQLKIAWIAKSNAEQRAGRAGRCRAGYCFRLYSVEDYESMNATQIAEMKRAAIHDVCLHAKMFAPENTTVKKFLSLAPEPPSPQAVEWSLEFLEQLGALYSDHRCNPNGSVSAYELRSSVYNCRERREPELTELGKHIAQLPLEPQLARLLLFGIALKCFNPVVTLVAALSHRDPFILPLGEERSAALAARDEFGRCDYSDHLMLLRAFNAYSRTTQGARQLQFCKMKFLSPNTMKMISGIRRQLLVELRRLRMLPPNCNAFENADLNRYSSSWPMVQAAIVAGCYPGVGFVRAGNKLRKIRTSTESSATLHPGCIIKRQVLAPSRRSETINQCAQGQDDEEPVIEYLAFQELSKIDEGLTLRTVTVVPPISVVLFAGAIRLKKDTIEQFGVGDELSFDDALVAKDEDEEDDLCFDENGVCILEMEPWLAFKGRYRDMQAILKLRFKLMSYFLEVMKNPGRSESAEDTLLLSTLEHVLSEDHRRSKFYQCVDLQGPAIKSVSNNQLSRSRQSYAARSEELMDNGCSYRQKGNEDGGDHVQKLRRAQSTKEHNSSGGNASNSFNKATRFRDDYRLKNGAYNDARNEHWIAKAQNGSFRSSRSSGNFGSSCENRAMNSHQNFGGVSQRTDKDGVSSTLRYNDKFATATTTDTADALSSSSNNNNNNNSPSSSNRMLSDRSDRRIPPYCTFHTHRRSDVRFSQRRNFDSDADSTNGNSNSNSASTGRHQIRDGCCSDFGSCSSKMYCDQPQQRSRIDEKEDAEVLDEEQVPDDPCSTTSNNAESEAKQRSPDEVRTSSVRWVDGANDDREANNQGSSHHNPGRAFEGVGSGGGGGGGNAGSGRSSNSSGRCRSSVAKRLSGSGWHMGPKEFIRRGVSYSSHTSAGAFNGEQFRNFRFSRNSASRSVRDFNDELASPRDSHHRERTEEGGGSEGKRYFEYYNKNTKTFFGRGGGGARREATVSRRRSYRGRDVC